MYNVLVEKEHIKRRQNELSRQQAIYVASRAKGLPKQQSAIMAGYNVDKQGSNAGRIEESPKVQKALALTRANTAETIGVTKDDIAQGLLDAANMARTMADPQAMVRAFSELGKMLGFYAEEKKKVTHELGERTLEAIRSLPDHELLKLAKGKVVEGEVLGREEKPDDESRSLQELSEPESDERDPDV